MFCALFNPHPRDLIPAALGNSQPLDRTAAETPPKILERFRARWIPVRVKKTRQNKRLEPGSDSIRTDKALGTSRQAGLKPVKLSRDIALDVGDGHVDDPVAPRLQPRLPRGAVPHNDIGLIRI